MFCARCGEQIPEASETCPLCGQEANVKLPPASAQGVAAPAPALDSLSAAAVPPIRKDLQGVGGWLLFFCISFTVLWPTWVLFWFWLNMIAVRPAFLLPLSRLALGIAAGIVLWMGNPMAIVLLRAYFIFGALLMLWYLSGWVYVASHFGLSSAYSVRFAVTQAPSILLLVSGVLYFSISERVRATYGRKLFQTLPRF